LVKILHHFSVQQKLYTITFFEWYQDSTVFWRRSSLCWHTLSLYERV